MNNNPRKILVGLIKQHGPSLCDDPILLRNILLDKCGEYRREIHLLVSALQERIPQELLIISSIPLEILLPRLTLRLQDHLAVTTEAARWAVESWGLALGVISQHDIKPLERESEESAPIVSVASPAFLTPIPPTQPVSGKFSKKLLVLGLLFSLGLVGLYLKQGFIKRDVTTKTGQNEETRVIPKPTQDKKLPPNQTAEVSQSKQEREFKPAQPPSSSVKGTPGPPHIQEKMNRFNKGQQWVIDWQSQFHYRGILQIKEQLAANQYLSRITVSFANENNVKRTVSMDGLLTVQGQKVVIRCSNPSVSWWDTDDFYLEWENDSMTGYNIDKKGRRGTALFRFEGARPETTLIPPSPSPLAGDTLSYFQVGRKWAIDWQSQFHYRGILQIKEQLAANQYLSRITVSFANENNVKRTVSMDGLLTVQGKKVVISCSNPSESWWDTDDFYLEWKNDSMTGYNIDKKGRRGTAIFRSVH